jgi:spore coat polysaccharide biosynthesis protein SpsF
MRITATIQARMSSTRLPGKVLKPILGKPMLELQIERIKRSILIDEIIIATTNSPKDDPIVSLAKKLKIPYFRGSEDDVLDRIVSTLKKYDVEIHDEFMGDNPVPDPFIIDSIIGFYLKNADKYDYVSNCLKTTYPPGLEVSLYPSNILYDAEKHVGKSSPLREHVGIHIYQHPERYRIHNIEAPSYLNYPDLHLEVDTLEDFEVIKSVFEAFYPKNPYFDLLQIIDFMNDNKDLFEKNKLVPRRWKKYRKDG